MARRFGIGCLLLFSLGVTLACSLSQSAATPPPATSVPITRELLSVLGEPGTDSGTGEDFEIVVLNRSDMDICHVHITGSNASAWGPGVLVEGEAIRAGMSWTSAPLSGAHDVLLRSCEDVVVATDWELLSDTTLTVGGPGLIPLRVVNESAAVICYLYISPATQSGQGEDRLGLWETVDSQSRAFFVEPGTYNLRAVDCEDNLVRSEEGVNVYAATDWTIPADEGLNVVPETAFAVTIENMTSSDICYVYIAPAAQQTWGKEWLGDDETIAPGATRAFDVPTGVYDVLAADCADAVVDAAWEVSADVVLRPGLTGSVAVQIINNTGRDICYVYISPSAAEQWGEDWLTDMEIVAANGEIRTFFVEPDTYDLTMQDCEGDEIATQSEVLVNEDWVWTIAD